jgi:hypothetical protein
MSRNSFQNDRGVWSGWIGLQSITRAHRGVLRVLCVAWCAPVMDFRPTRGLRSLREAAPGLRRNTARLLKGFQPDLRAGRRPCSLQPPQTHTVILK